MPDPVSAVPACPRGSSPASKRDGCSSPGRPRLRCRGCLRTSIEQTGTPFAGYRWPRQVIVMAVRWYGRFRLSAADVRDLLAERGIDVSARTVLAWVHTFGPLLAAEARRHAPPVGQCWYVDETYLRVSGRWMYLYRAVDEPGRVIDVLLREQRNLAGARAFFAQALARRGARPILVVTDEHPTYRRAIRRHARGARHVRTGLHRARGETTTAIERSHVPIKDRLRPMRGLQSVRTGQRVVETVEAMPALRRGVHPGDALAPLSAHERAREVAKRVGQLAAALRSPTR